MTQVLKIQESSIRFRASVRCHWTAGGLTLRHLNLEGSTGPCSTPYSTSYLSDPRQTPASFPDHGEVQFCYISYKILLWPWLSNPHDSHVPPGLGSSGPSHVRHVLQCPLTPSLNRAHMRGLGRRGGHPGPLWALPSNLNLWAASSIAKPVSLCFSPEGKQRKSKGWGMWLHLVWNNTISL